MNRTIPLFHVHISQKSKDLVNEVMNSSFVNEGELTDRFESEFKQEFGIRNFIPVSSCTAALHLALELCGVRGHEVIIPSQSFIATGTAVLMAGGNPVFSDILMDGNINPHDVKKKITKNTKAIVAVAWGGIPPKVHMLQEFGLPVIVDNAHGTGNTICGEDIGNIADFTCYSFQSIKSLCAVNGGGISFINDDYNNILREKKWFGINKRKMSRTFDGDREYSVNTLGYKYDFTNFNAAMALGNLSDYKERMFIRSNIAMQYETQIIRGPSFDTILTDCPYTGLNDTSSWWLYTLKVSDRQKLIERLRSANIECSVVDKRFDLHPIFGGPYNLPVQAVFDKIQLNIPCHEGLTQEEVDYIIDVINE